MKDTPHIRAELTSTCSTLNRHLQRTMHFPHYLKDFGLLWTLEFRPHPFLGANERVSAEKVPVEMLRSRKVLCRE